MALIGFLDLSIAFLCFVLLHLFFNKRPHESFPRTWPLLGMYPGLIANLHQLYDYSTMLLENSNMTYANKGPWLSGLDTLATADPANIRHIMSSNFSNYTKGPEFKEMFHILGNSIFNVDSDLWENLRKSLQAILYHPDFQRFSFSSNMDKLKNRLLPFLDHVAKEKMVVDMQDVLERYSFDTMLNVCTGFDARTLSIELPEVEFYRAFDDFEEAIFLRHFKPRILWKLQYWLGLGVEKRMRRAHETVDRICAKYISKKKEEMRSGQRSNRSEATDLLTCYMNVDTTKYKLFNPYDDKFQRDTIFMFMTAGRGTGSILARFLWLVSKHPEALAKIRQEIKANLPRISTRGNDDETPFGPADLKKLVYLHAALCETLRLYAPVPFNRKTPIKPEILPSGHRVHPNMNVVMFIYAMGRMKAVWGEDALEFKPERWITESGGLKQEPPSKFFVFSTGPRTCLGKDMAFSQFKTVLVQILQNYDINVVDGQQVESIISTVLRIKGGLKVTVTKRCSA